MAPHRSPLKRPSLSPPVWKAQLRQRCLQRLKRDRGQLLDRLRRPDAGASASASTSVSEEMQRLVEASASVDDLLLLGRLQEGEYLEIIHALEDALRHETGEDDEEQEAEHMAELEDAELEAMLAGLDLLDEPQQQQQQQQQQTQQQQTQQQASADELHEPADVSVLCPICKAGYLREHADAQTPVPFIACGCGFTFRVKYVYHTVLEDFQDKIVNAFLAHRCALSVERAVAGRPPDWTDFWTTSCVCVCSCSDACSADPTFEKKASLDDGADVLCLQCALCGCDHALP
ncbi:hypothetical protein PHYPSEUDO_006264 [Phytophthora pseudosyringae]|uniref:RPA-interacting protein N-terminal domain-containing protein n=1 Tax=Phytophthora pseudosyringae TaxID=221518 RepID=A0A8T1VM60_9STRA|nr:hypothetical protein PHYPSEUDO_006264 [Phytophthora pseudosyringae]